jgi:hypothetical protein
MYRVCPPSVVEKRNISLTNNFILYQKTQRGNHHHKMAYKKKS